MNDDEQGSKDEHIPVQIDENNSRRDLVAQETEDK